MFCPKCGNQVADGTAFCNNCGASLNAQTPPQQPQSNPYQASYNAVPQAPVLGMKWYKFLIYFLLFAIALLNVGGGISALTGAQYTTEGENVSKLVYAIYPKLETADLIYGISCIVLAVFQIFLRFQLAGYKAKAPMYVSVMYIATALIIAIYSFSVVAIVPSEVVIHSELIGQGTGAIIGGLVMLVLNKTYFDKRKHLFVN